MHLYSKNLSTRATISSLNMSEVFPACISCSNIFILSDNSSGFSERYNFFENDFFETPEAETIKPGDLSNFISVLPGVDLLPGALTSKYNSFAKSYYNFLSAKPARSTL